jgi:mRNA-degrading endonuclease RelE of RelBE toxin-antitoxin system
MGWKIEFDENAERELKKLDPQIAKRILAFLFNRVAPLDVRKTAPNSPPAGSALRASPGTPAPVPPARGCGWL